MEPPTGLIPWFSKLREILTLRCCITLSSSRENQRSPQEVARRIFGAVVGEIRAKSSQDLISRQRAISGAVAGESTHKTRHTKYPSQTLIPRITLFAICLSFSSPPLHLFLCLFFALFPYVFLFVFPRAFYLLASLLAKNLLIWIHLKCSTWIIFDPYALVLKPQLS